MKGSIKMFEVRMNLPGCFKITGFKYKVYKVHVVHEDETYFLIYNEGKWQWVNANRTCPA